MLIFSAQRRFFPTEKEVITAWSTSFLGISRFFQGLFTCFCLCTGLDWMNEWRCREVLFTNNNNNRKTVTVLNNSKVDLQLWSAATTPPAGYLLSVLVYHDSCEQKHTVQYLWLIAVCTFFIFNLIAYVSAFISCFPSSKLFFFFYLLLRALCQRMPHFCLKDFLRRC